MNMLIIIAFFICVYALYLWFKRKSMCFEIVAKNRIEFFKNANYMLSSDGLSDEQKDKIYKWADTIESREHASYFFVAINELYEDMKKGVIPDVSPAQTEEYTEAMAKLFGHWMVAQMYSKPFFVSHTRHCLAYILSDEKAEIPVKVEVNRDVFKHDMVMPLAA